MSAEPARASLPTRLATWGRRLVSMLLVVAVAALALVALLVGLLTAPLTAVAGLPHRLVRFSAFLLLYACVDLTGVAAAGWFWMRCLKPVPGQSREERLREHSYDLLRRLLERLCRAAERIFGLRLLITPPVPPASRAAGAPLLVFARHAGPGDSFLLVRTLLGDAGVRPQVVLKRFLRWEPCLDVLIGRVPHVFVPSRTPERTVGAIAALAAGLRPGDAVVIFPEGGNFTGQRRARAISHLRRHGETRRAARALRRRHVLPPNFDGPLALLREAPPTARIAVVAHTGLERMDSPARIWHGVPLREPVTATWWSVPRAAVPTEPGAAGEWLEQQWTRVDAWIDERNARRDRRSD